MCVCACLCVCIIFQPSLCLYISKLYLFPYSSTPACQRIISSQEQVEMVTGGEQSKFVTAALKNTYAPTDMFTYLALCIIKKHACHF